MSLVLGFASLILCIISLAYVFVFIEAWVRDTRHTVAWILAPLFPVPGLVCGAVAMRRMKNSGRRKGTHVLALTGIILSAAALVIFPLVGPQVREASIRAQCVANLRLIAGAKENWAREKEKKQTDTPKDAELFGPGTSYIREKPVCLQGGTYSVNPVRAKPSCTAPGHTF